MHVLQGRNVGQILPVGMAALQEHGRERESRNGPVIVFDGPVTTVYEEPRERVLFYPTRDANPFFHFFEGLWMIAGRRDVKSLARYTSSISQFSDDGKTFHGAYGYRWRNWFGVDQLEKIATALRENPDDRRCVLQMWDATADLGKKGKDFPCNTQAIFSRNVDGALDMSVFNRSNDMIWGTYGANAVHFSMLQEFMAAWIGCEVGQYWQISNNLHAYVGVFSRHEDLCTAVSDDMYSTGEVEPFPMVSTDIKVWQEDLGMLLDDGMVIGFRDPFFRRVATPILMAHEHYRDASLGEHRYTGALEILKQCSASDWRLACQEWIQRRHKKWSEKNADNSGSGE